jgi:pimeloyl-ACP methyl ester carboxylesterase
MDRTMFAPQLATLAAHGYRAIAFDHRARTDRFRGPYSLEDLADDCIGLLDHLGARRCVLVGMSMGGFTALRAAIHHPGRLAGVGLLGGAMVREFGAAEQAEWAAGYEAIRAGELVPRQFAEEQAAVCFGPVARRRQPDLIESWVQRWAAHSAEAVYWEARSWIGQGDISAAVAESELPFLIVQGDDDTALPLEDALATFALLRNATMARLPGIGHTANLESPELVDRLLLRFLADVSEADPDWGTRR